MSKNLTDSFVVWCKKKTRQRNLERIAFAEKVNGYKVHDVEQWIRARESSYVTGVALIMLEFIIIFAVGFCVGAISLVVGVMQLGGLK